MTSIITIQPKNHSQSQSDSLYIHLYMGNSGQLTSKVGVCKECGSLPPETGINMVKEFFRKPILHVHDFLVASEAGHIKKHNAYIAHRHAFAKTLSRTVGHGFIYLHHVVMAPQTRSQRSSCKYHVWNIKSADQMRF